MSHFETITTTSNNHVFEIGLNRPLKMNSFTLQMIADISHALRDFDANDDLRCALIFGHGDHFTTGLDLGQVGPQVASGESIIPKNSIDPMDLFPPRRRKPLVVAVHGWCITIGVELLLAADIRIAAERTRFTQLEVCRGIMPFGGATVRFPQVAGWGNAMRYLLTGDEFNAQEAHRMGLIQEVVPDGKQLERARELAHRVSKQAPLAVQEIIHSARIGMEEGIPKAIESFYAQTRKLMVTEDAMEGLMSFMERREGNFKGR